MAIWLPCARPSIPTRFPFPRSPRCGSPSTSWSAWWRGPSADLAMFRSIGDYERIRPINITRDLEGPRMATSSAGTQSRTPVGRSQVLLTEGRCFVAAITCSKRSTAMPS